jgi:hypothetical protein
VLKRTLLGADGWGMLYQRFSGAVARIDIPRLIVRWAGSPVAAGVVALTAAAITTVIIAAGGPPTPVTHVYYFVVVAAAMLWGPAWGVAVGAACGALSGPVSGALAHGGQLGHPDWILRCVSMVLVGAACGALTRSLLARLDECETLNRETIAAFVRAIDARDPYTARHSERVADYAAALARELGVDEAGVERIHLAALLHDVGKLGLERSVLQKPGALTDDEWLEVRAHPVLSAHIISGVSRFASYLDGARHHHERYDGAGYPDGLAGEDIPYDARIIAVADAYEAMTADRAYRAARTHEEALRCIAEGSGTQFDPLCADAFQTLEIHRRLPSDTLPQARHGVLVRAAPTPALGELGGQ